LITEATNDAGLLERFQHHRDQTAFLELVKRHGASVLRVIRRHLTCEQDVEDVFQATFLVLAHKAGEVAWDDSVHAWLYAVAHRLAQGARSRNSRRQRREQCITALASARRHSARGEFPEPDHPQADPHEEIERRDLARLVHQALEQLPEKYRAPVVLCYLEGKSNEEAARQLGWPAGSMSRRLHRARSLLRRRLALAGVSLAIGVLSIVAVTRSKHAGRLIHSPAAGAGSSAVAFHAGRGGDANLHRLVAETLQSGELPRSREQVQGLARKAERMAELLVIPDPGRNQGAWLAHASRLRLAALDLGRVARTDDAAAIESSVRALDAACVACHTVFHQ
jgi:RNA polymerase sigma-70 factor (ECF subfamily)